jgi:hypothetical protein
MSVMAEKVEIAYGNAYSILPERKIPLFGCR